MSAFMQPRRLRVPLILILLLLVGACASNPKQRGTIVAIAVHDTIAAFDDTEHDLVAKGQITAAQDVEFSKHLIVLLSAGKQLDAAVRLLPSNEAGAKAQLKVVITNLTGLTSAVIGVLPDSPAKALLLGKAAKISDTVSQISLILLDL